MEIGNRVKSKVSLDFASVKKGTIGEIINGENNWWLIQFPDCEPIEMPMNEFEVLSTNDTKMEEILAETITAPEETPATEVVEAPETGTDVPVEEVPTDEPEVAPEVPAEEN